MDVVFAVLVAIGSVVALVRFSKHEARRRVRSAQDKAAGQLQHRRSGDYPSTCSWCKNTTLARRLFVFERTSGTWAACDVLVRLQSCPDNEVAELGGALVFDQPRWRRFCSEKCTKEFFNGEHVQIAETFVTCDYCSVRFPGSLIRCPHCGAAKRAT